MLDMEQKVLAEHQPDLLFPGIYLAQVIDTNDPLNVGRVRFICPELHDSDMDLSMTQWAVQAPFTGSPRAGMWSAPVKGDIISIMFQKGDPHSPMWMGVVHPTTRRHYPLLSQHQPSQTAQDINGNADTSRPSDEDSEYLPQDGRPMGVGIADPYGSTLWLSGIGFFPKEHAKPPEPVGIDPITKNAYKQRNSPPKVNDPDMKFMAAVTKYGNYMLLSDVGYEWKKDGTYGEIEGDFLKDDEFEIGRAKALRRQFTQDRTTGKDERRIEFATRYGHLFLMSDVGWAQSGPKDSKSRPGEYLSEGRYLSRESARDERWIKIRTRGGMLFQMSDIGLDPGQDEYITRTSKENIDADPDYDRILSSKDDARFMRMSTRYGWKFVLDDTESDSVKPEQEEKPRAKGILLKGRRTGASKTNNDKKDNPTGYYFEIQERDSANRLSIGSPLGSAIELSDNFEYAALTAGGAKGQAMPWRGLQENEFTERSLVEQNPSILGNMLFLDNENKFVMLRTRSGMGPEPDNNNIVNDDVGRFRAGFEARDGENGDGSWVEINDSDNRGMWLTRKNKMLILRSGGDPVKQLIVMNDGDNKISIYNTDPDGKVEIYTAGDLEARADGNVKMFAGKKFDISAVESIRLRGGNSILEINDKGVQTRGDMMAKIIRADLKQPQPNGDPPELPEITDPPETIAPGDRGQRYN